MKLPVDGFMNKLVDIIAAVILFYLIQSNYDCLPYCFGGSLVFVPVCATLMLVSMHVKRYRAGISMLVILCLILLGLNKIAYMELYRTHEASKIFNIVYALTISIIVWSAVTVRIAFIKPGSGLKPTDLNLFEAQTVVLERLCLIISTGILTVLVTGAAYRFENYDVYYKDIYALFPLSLVVLLHMTVMSLIAAAFASRIPRYYYLYTYSGIERKRVPNIKKYFALSVVGLFIIGCGLEMMRGQWLLWASTMSLLVSIIAAQWRIWKYLLDEDSGEMTPVEIPDPINPMAFRIKYVILAPLPVLVYAFILVVIV